MARIALGITLALLLATCFFGFETWNKVQGLNNQVATVTGEWNTTKTELAKSKADLKTAEDNLAAAKAEADKAKSDLATAQAGLDAANTQVTTLKGQVDDLTKQLAAAKGATPAPVAQSGPTPEELQKLNDQLKDKDAQIAELNQLKDTLTNKVKDAESRADDLQKTVDHYKSGTVRNGLEGEVLAYNPGWNFVVISIGDRQGAVANAEMILKRGDEQIGKVRITSVEPSTSVADVIPGSLSRGVRIQPGDRVIFPGS